eukprot:gene9373-1584_t
MQLRIEESEKEKEVLLTFKKELKLKSYDEQTYEWPQTGRYILAQYDEDSIIVYQAFNKKIADWAVKHQYFGGPDYSTTRMTWIKTNFLWMQYRSGWSSKSNQTHTLAIWLKRSSFEYFLSHNYYKKNQEDKKERGSVRIQWDPDHNPVGSKCQRRAVQIGIKGDLMKGFLEPNGDIIQIQDISEFCQEQFKKNVKNQKNFKNLITPHEKVYDLKEEKVMKHLIEFDKQNK